LLTGTGKILTAEALVEKLRGFLYTVSASELDCSADSVESALEKTFDLAAAGRLSYCSMKPTSFSRNAPITSWHVIKSSQSSFEGWSTSTPCLLDHE